MPRRHRCGSRLPARAAHGCCWSSRRTWLPRPQRRARRARPRGRCGGEAIAQRSEGAASPASSRAAPATPHVRHPDRHLATTLTLHQPSRRSDPRRMAPPNKALARRRGTGTATGPHQNEEMLRGEASGRCAAICRGRVCSAANSATAPLRHHHHRRSRQRARRWGRSPLQRPAKASRPTAASAPRATVGQAHLGATLRCSPWPGCP
mmetsp:Transcript_172668/g.553397  ORF Transcript_172668/g.553397 Transcript_172668/m.553397 type:complete len:207 (-) Transcript_172668:81-701(-)